MKSIPTLGNQNYASDTNLIKRKKFANHFKPRVDLVKKIVNLLNLTGKEKILDAGCGNGDALIKIRNKYHHQGKLFGIDIASGILKKAKEASIDTASKIHFSVGDARALRFSDESFDVVILKHVLNNISSPKTALVECHRVLKKGGQLVIVLTGKKTRLILKDLKPRIAQVLDLDFFPHAEGHINLENINLFLNKSLKNYTLTTFRSKMEFKKVGLYLKYIDSGRDFWGKIDNKKWQKALNFSKEYLEKIIHKKGSIKDYSTLGIVVIKK